MLRRHFRTSQSVRPIRYGPPRRSSALKAMMLFFLFGAVTVLSGRELWEWSGWGGGIERTASLLTFTGGSDVYVALDAGEPQRAEPSLNMYPNDHVRTGNAHAILTFFDGTVVGLGQNTDLRIMESAKGSRHSEIDLELIDGVLWMRTPEHHLYTGSILRRVLLPSFSLDFPPDSEVTVAGNAIRVFSADGAGVRMEQKGGDDVLFVGEGQKLEFPQESEDIPDNLYALRSPLGVLPSDSLASTARSLVASLSDENKEVVEGGQQAESEELLTVLAPPNGLLVSGETIEVTGNVGEYVTNVRINGYKTDVAPDRSFRQELALPNEEEVVLHIEALDEKGISLAETQRSVRRDISPPEVPIIDAPSGSGTIYRTQSRELEIRGRASKDVVGIIVNDYRLQLFKSGDREWSYLASVELGNFNRGTNVYEARAIDASGNQSEAAVITILLEEGIADSENGTLNIDNVPIMPGSLAIVGPTQGDPFVATGSEFSMYGTVPPQTFGVWINGYRLQLYEPGQRLWKYVASYDLNTMRRGRNVYDVVIRNRRGELLDRLEYIVLYQVINE